jgi:Mitochondrial biogenesis AIM24
MRLTLGKGAAAIYRARAVPVSLSRHGIRSIQIKAAPLGEQTVVNGVNLPISSTPGSASSAGRSLHCSMDLLSINSVLLQDAKFHVVGAPYSMLSVSLSASQNLYTRRGTLVGLSGKAENVFYANC